MSTPIRKGSRGSDVVVWQKIIGVEPDGIFGEQTLAATIQWQAAHQLKADGIVGIATLAAAGVDFGSEAESPATKTDKWAYQVAKSANASINPKYTEAQLQYGLSVARGEGYYGKGWGHISPLSAQFGLRGDEGLGSNNWGAHQGTGDAGSFPHVDTHADGSPYVGYYKRYSTPELGFLDMMHTIFFPNPKRKKADVAKSLPSLRKAVFAQHANGYFELAPEKYLASVLKNYNTLTASTGWSKILSEKGSSGILGFIGGALAYVGLRKAYSIYKEKKNA